MYVYFCICVFTFRIGIERASSIWIDDELDFFCYNGQMEHVASIGLLGNFRNMRNYITLIIDL